MLSSSQVGRLRRAGFIDYEIAQYNWAVAADGSPQIIDLDTATWQATLSSRRKWVERCRALGWADFQIRDAIMNFYKSKAHSPWDFLKAEYIPPKKTDFRVGVKRRSRSRTKKLYQGGRKS